MRAAQVTQYKRPIGLVEIAEPVMGPRDVLVEVRAAGLNQIDEKVRGGEFKPVLPYRAPFTLGHDVAGVVVATGREVTAYAAGDRVWSRPRDGRIGTFAELIAIDESDIAPVPASLSLLEAGSFPLVGLTAWQALVEVGQLQPGQKVLIHAGSGGVGTVAIQLAKHLGATVATTVSAPNAEFVRGLGADVVVDYRTEKFDEVLSGYDLVLDGVGAAHVLRSLRVVKPGGKVIGISGPPTPEFAVRLELNPVLRAVFAVTSARVRRQARRLGVSYEFLFMHADGHQLAELGALVDAGVITPVVGRTVAFADLPDVLGAIGTDGTRGKTVVTVTS